MKYAVLILTISFSIAVASAQVSDTTLESLAFNADVMTNAARPAHRAVAETAFRKHLVVTLSDPSSWAEGFDSLAWIQNIMAPDSAFRILTWQLEKEAGAYEYFGVIQTIDGNLTQLHDKRSLNSEFGSYNANTWYGALYYGIHQFAMADGSPAYLILGFNANDRFTNQKTGDVLTFNNGAPVFGAEVFDFVNDSGTPDVKSRIILEYSDAAAGRMRFDREKGYLVYDNVIVIDGGLEGPIYTPDGSFHAYEYKDGRWAHIEKLFHQTVDTPPGDGIQREDKDLFGRDRKKN